MHYWHRAKGFVVLRYWIVTKESSYPSSLISLHSQYSSPSLSLSSFSNRHPHQQKNNRTEQQQNNQTQSGSHETLSSTESPLLFRFIGANLEGKSIDINRMASAWRSSKKCAKIGTFFFLYVFFVLTTQKRKCKLTQTNFF